MVLKMKEPETIEEFKKEVDSLKRQVEWFRHNGRVHEKEAERVQRENFFCYLEMRDLRRVIDKAVAMPSYLLALEVPEGEDSTVVRAAHAAANDFLEAWQAFLKKCMTPFAMSMSKDAGPEPAKSEEGEKSDG